ncbi:MAG: tRNA (adenosine(37)-N6)-threonylcarbamoyltransferase complex ATPase subunit type 1 TsaE [Bryobacterales bacterium]|nr:tRNA (adenosine(37)-N6)-threonylcarbamoyltransferase complex ATPase subunit type 1 TsaE [Bryobacterales bacterium]
MTFLTNSEEETIELGRRLAREVLPPQGVVLLIGNLGAGKTTLTKGIAEARGAVSTEDVSSPTYTLIHEYGEPVSVYHIDLYRLDTAEEVATLGLDEIFDRDALVLIEWGERFPQLFPPNTIRIELERTFPDGRRIVVSGLPGTGPS